jgi:hypothetical protein
LLTVEAPGFKKFEGLHNKLDANSTLSIDASLVVGSPTETFEVVADIQAMQTESAAVEKLVTRDQIDSLELNAAIRCSLRRFNLASAATLHWVTSRSA